MLGLTGGLEPSALAKALIYLPPLIIAVVLHEVAHGWVAWKLGDPTAKREGRISLNPLVHIDPMMTLALPALLIIMNSPLLFGGAKPVPVNANFFQNPRKGMLLVAIAGPLTNFSLAILLVFLQKLTHPIEGIIPSLLMDWVTYGIFINIALGVFNLIPIPPLDGGRVAIGLLPQQLASALARVEPYGLFLVVFLLYMGVFDVLLMPVIRLLLYLAF